MRSAGQGWTKEPNIYFTRVLGFFFKILSYNSAFASIGINVNVQYYGHGSVNAGTA